MPSNRREEINMAKNNPKKELKKHLRELAKQVKENNKGVKRITKDLKNNTKAMKAAKGDNKVEKDGVKASCDLYYPPDYLDRQSLATVFAEQAKDIGIEVKLVGADWDTIYANMYSSAALMQQTSPDPYKSIYQQ